MRNKLFSMRMPDRIKQILEEASVRSGVSNDPDRPSMAAWLIHIIKQEGRKVIGDERYEAIMQTTAVKRLTEAANEQSAISSAAVRKPAGPAPRKRTPPQVVRKPKLGTNGKAAKRTAKRK